MRIFVRRKNYLHKRRGILTRSRLLRRLFGSSLGVVRSGHKLPVNIKRTHSGTIKRFKRRRQVKIVIYGVIGIILLAISMFFGLYLINQVFKLRSGRNLTLYTHIMSMLSIPLLYQQKDTNSDGVQTERYIKGLEVLNIPRSPGLVDPFEDVKLTKEQRVLLDHFYQSNSVYILDFRTPLTEILKFYKERLPQLGWLLVNEVPIESGYLTNGLYFVKDEQGLRIYTMTGKDIWFELIDKEDAYDAMQRRKDMIDLQVFAVDISRGRQVSSATGMVFNVPIGFRVVQEDILGTDLQRLIIYDKSNSVFIEILPVIKHQIKNKDDLKLVLEQYIYQKYNSKVIDVTCEKNDVEERRVLLFCEGIGNGDNSKILVLVFQSIDNRVVIIDLGEYSEKKRLYMRYLKEKFNFTDLEEDLVQPTHTVTDRE